MPYQMEKNDDGSSVEVYIPPTYNYFIIFGGIGVLLLLIMFFFIKSKK